MFKCEVCGTELPDGTTTCTNCLVCQEPPAKFKLGQLVKLDTGNRIIYNYVVGSYFNQEIKMRMYRLNETMALPVYREDWLEAVSEEELKLINDKLQYGQLVKPRSNGGWEEIKEEVTV